MPSAKMPTLSSRAQANIAPDPTKDLLGAVWSNQYSEENKDGVLFMGIAENKLMHDELVSYLNTNLSVTPNMLTYGDGPNGSHELRSELASYITREFHSRETVHAENITIMSGVTSIIDAVVFSIAEPGEGILVAQPLYTGFIGDFEDRAGLFPSSIYRTQEFHDTNQGIELINCCGTSIIPVCVPMGEDDVVSMAAIARHEAAYLKAESEGIKIRAVMLCNPHNPMGRCYGKEVIEGYMKFCERYGLHLICDEVYARAVFPSKDIPSPVPFTSILSLDIASHIDPSLVHVLYGMSKDFCCNGLRIGAFISLHNEPLHMAMGSMARFAWASSLSQKAWLTLLRDQTFLKGYFEEMRRRMTKAYDFATGCLKGLMVPYEPANVGQFIWIDLSGFLKEKTVEEERKLAWKMVESGVWFATGEAFKSEIPGYFRLTFATHEKDMRLGMDRLKTALENYLDWKAC